MSIFSLLLGKILPLYVLIVLGVFAGKRLGVTREAVTKLLLYIIVPAVVFYGTATTPLDGAILSLPLVFYVICCLLCLLAYAVSRLWWTDNTRNILAYTCGTGNNGYFGLPLVMMLFSERAFGIAVIAGIGFTLFECTLGFFVVAKGHMTAGQSLARLLRFPMPYAFMLGIAFNLLGGQLPQPVADLLIGFRGAFSVLGMMLIGLGLSSIRHLFIDLRFVAMAFVFKFVLWPALMAAFILADVQYFHLYTSAVHHVMVALAVVPLAANTVAYATELKTHPEKAASAVLLSTVFALVYIPVVMALVL